MPAPEQLVTSVSLRGRGEDEGEGRRQGTGSEARNGVGGRY